MAKQPVANFTANTQLIKDPVAVTGGERPGALMGASYRTAGEGLANFMTQAATLADTVFRDYKYGELSKKVDDIASRTIADSGAMGEKARQWQEGGGASPQEVVTLSPESAMAASSFDQSKEKDFSKNLPVNQHVKRLESEAEVIRRAEDAGILSGKEANTRIQALIKEYTAQYPGLEGMFRKAAVSATEKQLYGDTQVYNMLVDKAKTSAAQKGVEEFEKEVGYLMAQGMNRGEAVNAARRNASLKQAAANADASMKVSNAQNDTVTVGAFWTSLNNPVDENGQPRVTPVSLMDDLVALDRTFGNRTTADKDAQFNNAYTDWAAKAEASRMQSIYAADSMLSQGTITPEKHKMLVDAVNSRYDGVLTRAKDFAGLRSMATYQKAVGASAEVLRNKLSLASPVSEYFKGKQPEEYNRYMNIVRSMMDKNKLDPSMPISELPKERQTEVRALLASYGMTEKQWTNIQSIAALENGGASAATINSLTEQLEAPTKKPVDAIISGAKGGDKVDGEELLRAKTNAYSFNKDTPITEGAVRDFMLTVRGASTEMGAGEGNDKLVKKVLNKWNRLDDEFISRMEPRDQVAAYREVFSQINQGLFGDPNNPNATSSMVNRLLSMRRKDEQGNISPYRESWQLAFNPVTRRFDAVPARETEGVVGSIGRGVSDFITGAKFAMSFGASDIYSPVDREMMDTVDTLNAMFSSYDRYNDKAKAGVNVVEVGEKLAAVFNTGYTSSGDRGGERAGYGFPTTVAPMQQEKAAVRENNVLNLRKAGSDEFQQFATPVEAIAASSRQVGLYISGKSKAVTEPLTTVDAIVGKWNNEDEKGSMKKSDYVSVVTKNSGLSPDDVIDTPLKKAQLLYGMQFAEQGKAVLPLSHILNIVESEG